MKASPETLGERLAGLIAAAGPISVAQYMGEANAHYYGKADPLGAEGDFVTAPEVSQMFGELVGIWLADIWARAGSRERAHYVELGPGRGTLAEDALRAMRGIGLEPGVELVETSLALRGEQSARLSGARWHGDLDTLPDEGPLLIVANEFFDALPIRQLVATERGWRERMVFHDGEAFHAAEGPPLPSDSVQHHLRGAPPGSIVEISPVSVAIVREIAARLVAQGGAALIVDYGHDGSAHGDTLQAVWRHAYADPWSNPGEHDLTAHVDFGALALAARSAGVRVIGPRSQGEWLEAMGIGLRAARLTSSASHRADGIEAARHRLTAPEEMGTLFKVMALVAPGWPDPAGL